MKKLGIIILAAALLNGCNDELDLNPLGTIPNELIGTDLETLNTFLTSAYGILDGNLDDADVWRSSASNWVYGEVTTDNAYKGSEPGDAAEIDQFEAYVPSATNSFLDVKWRALYEGINRANSVIKRANNALDLQSISKAEHDQLIGEAKFLRAHYHFEAKKMWNKIPYIDETVSSSIPNTVEGIWERIEEDFQAAIDALSPTSEAGRANRWMALTYLAKVHMYQLDYDLAKPLLNSVINDGPYELTALFSDNFNAEKNNNSESIFAVQFSVNNSTANGSLGRWGDILNFPNTNEAGGGCCGFFQPSQNLVNAFKTDAAGLPLLDSFNEVDVTSEEQQFNKFLSENDNDETGYDATFVPEQGTLDPRLDRTVGRRGIDYQGFAEHEGRSWIRDMANAGPFLPRKNVHRQDQVGSQSTDGGAWSPNVNQLNYNVIRFSEVLLWRAEIAAFEGDLGLAVQLVDRVRLRAANPDDFVKSSDGVTAAANYLISEYGAFENQEQAIKAVDHEQRIELAMEGHRFFELVRKNKALEVLGEYLKGEQEKIDAENGTLKSFIKRQYLDEVTFEENDNYFPIPQTIIDLSGGVITQN